MQETQYLAGGASVTVAEAPPSGAWLYLARLWVPTRYSSSTTEFSEGPDLESGALSSGVRDKQ